MRRLHVYALVLALALVAAACGGDDGGGDEPTETALSGTITVSGSSTVQPISSLVAEIFQGENQDVSISVDGPGTGDGFELFCKGETDISDASRPIADDEAPICEENGINYVELEVALDGLTVMTNPANSSVSCLNFGDLYALFGPESQGFTNWSDANALAAEVGGNGNFPDASLDITAPGEESGTYDAFIELALGDIIEERGQEEVLRPDYQSSANDNQIVGSLAGTAFSLGWVGFSFYEQNQDVVKALQIDGGDGCVAPTTETIASGEYPVSRTLYIYVNKAKAAEKPALKAFVDLYMTDIGLLEAVQQVGYVELPEDVIAESRSTWQAEAPAA
jgi:phosphate transport system substrate-binding protein